MSRPPDEQLSAYLDGEYGPPHPEAAGVLHDALEAAVRDEPSFCGLHDAGVLGARCDCPTERTTP
jgi:hypothetical protein